MELRVMIASKPLESFLETLKNKLDSEKKLPRKKRTHFQKKRTKSSKTEDINIYSSMDSDEFTSENFKKLLACYEAFVSSYKKSEDKKKQIIFEIASFIHAFHEEDSAKFLLPENFVKSYSGFLNTANGRKPKVSELYQKIVVQDNIDAHTPRESERSSGSGHTDEESQLDSSTSIKKSESGSSLSTQNSDSETSTGDTAQIYELLRVLQEYEKVDAEKVSLFPQDNPIQPIQAQTFIDILLGDNGVSIVADAIKDNLSAILSIERMIFASVIHNVENSKWEEENQKETRTIAKNWQLVIKKLAMSEYKHLESISEALKDANAEVLSSDRNFDFQLVGEDDISNEETHEVIPFADRATVGDRLSERLTVLARHDLDPNTPTSEFLTSDDCDDLVLSPYNAQFAPIYSQIIGLLTSRKPEDLDALAEAIDYLVKETFETAGQKLLDNYENEDQRYIPKIYEDCSNSFASLSSKIDTIVLASIINYSKPEEINNVITAWLNVLDKLIKRKNYQAASGIFSAFRTYSDLAYILFKGTANVFISQLNQEHLRYVDELLKKNNEKSFEKSSVSSSKNGVPHFSGYRSGESIFNKMKVRADNKGEDADQLKELQNYVSQFRIYHGKVNLGNESELAGLIKTVTIPGCTSDEQKDQDNFRIDRIKKIKFQVSNPVFIQYATQKKLNPLEVHPVAEKLNALMHKKGSLGELTGLLNNFSAVSFNQEEIQEIHRYNKQHYYHSLIKNKVLKTFVEGTPLKSIKIHLGGMSTEDRVIALNEAISNADMTKEKYAQLLKNVGISLEDDVLNRVWEEEQKRRESDNQHWVEVFESVYDTLYQVTPGFKKQNFVSGLKDCSFTEKYKIITDHIANLKKQKQFNARSVVVEGLVNTYIRSEDSKDSKKNAMAQNTLIEEITKKAVPDDQNSEKYKSKHRETFMTLSNFDALVKITNKEERTEQVKLFIKVHEIMQKMSWHTTSHSFITKLKKLPVVSQYSAIVRHSASSPTSRTREAWNLVQEYYKVKADERNLQEFTKQVLQACKLNTDPAPAKASSFFGKSEATKVKEVTEEISEELTNLASKSTM